jgi:hypothetical protein
LTTYVEVAGALVRAGYLTVADVEAAAAVLADALIVEEAEEAQDAAAVDYADQEDLIAEAEVWTNEDAVQGDYVAAEIDEELIADSEEQKLVDKAVMVEAQVVIDAAYTDAAAALLAAELIDEANLDAVAAAIDDVWVVEVD